MSDGMSEYWRARRARQHEDKIMRDFYCIVRSLIDNQPSPNFKMNRLIELEKEISWMVAEIKASDDAIKAQQNT